jgi:hypothetical protein
MTVGDAECKKGRRGDGVLDFRVRPIKSAICARIVGAFQVGESGFDHGDLAGSGSPENDEPPAAVCGRCAR